VCTLARVQLAGIPIADADVAGLTGLLRERGFEDVAAKLEHAIVIETKVLGLTVTDRESILWALDDPTTDSLAELRGVVVAEHDWRVREGLV
jgi:hypothetical protein